MGDVTRERKDDRKMKTHTLHVEVLNVAQVGGQFGEEGVEAPVLTEMYHDHCPHR